MNAIDFSSWRVFYRSIRVPIMVTMLAAGLTMQLGPALLPVASALQSGLVLFAVRRYNLGSDRESAEVLAWATMAWIVGAAIHLAGAFQLIESSTEARAYSIVDLFAKLM